MASKAEELRQQNRVSCTDPNWQLIVEASDAGTEGVCVDDICTAEQIEFVASFAAKRGLTMHYGNHSFSLEPRRVPMD